MSSDQDYNFTNKELKLSYWYVTHKILLRRILIVFLGLICFVIWFYIVWQLAFFSVLYSDENFQSRKLIFGDNLFLSAINQLKPSPLQISDPVSLIGDGGRNDYFSEISNPNRDWLATFDYVITGQGDSKDTKSSFSLPLEQKYLMNLGVEGSISNLTISNIKWQRVYNSQRVFDERYRFIIDNDNFVAGVAAGDPSILSFDIKNESAFNYWRVGVQAFLYSGGNIASINYIVLEQLKAGEKRSVQLNWSSKLPRISHVEIIPEINVFDENNIMPQIASENLLN